MAPNLFRALARCAAATLALSGCAGAATTPGAVRGAQTRATAPKGFAVLYAFAGSPDGAQPYGGVTLDSRGDIFGTTFAGGSATHPSAGAGTGYELSPAGSGYAETVIHDFGADGYGPSGAPVVDLSGNVYASVQSGPKGLAYGSVVELSPAGSAYQEAAQFAFKKNVGALPSSALFDLPNGSNLRPPTLYKSILLAIAAQGGTGNGSITALTPGLVMSNTYAFAGSAKGDGAGPIGNLAVDVEDPGLGLYGTTSAGGAAGFGTVYSYVADTNVEAVLYAFRGGSGDGQTPVGGVVVDLQGNIYGTTEYGGANGAGVIFKLSKGSGGYTESILHSFGGPKDGANPLSAPTLALKGDLMYGTTHLGGTGSAGTIYQISTSGAHYKVLHAFTTSDGALPGYGSLAIAGSSLYGTAETGGAVGAGVVYAFAL